MHSLPIVYRILYDDALELRQCNVIFPRISYNVLLVSQEILGDMAQECKDA